MAKQYGIRDFSLALVQRIAQFIERHPGMKRTPLPRMVCEALDWRGADGRLCEMACRVTMLRLHADGLIQLPLSQICQPRRRAHSAPTAFTDRPAAGHHRGGARARAAAQLPLISMGSPKVYKLSHEFTT